MAGVTADAIDSGSPPAPSSLPFGANVAAQALLRNPTLRGLRAPNLARSLGITASEARDGIASVVGMVSRIALHGNSGLQSEPRLALAIGPLLSLDDAMARYASHRGPIVISPSPLYRPDTGPDAGRLGGSVRHYDSPSYRHSEAGDSFIPDSGQPANADQGQGAAGGGEPPSDLGVPGFGPGLGGSSGGSSAADQGSLQGDVSPPDLPPPPVPDNVPTTPVTGAVPTWVWLAAAAAGAVVVMGMRKKGRR